MLTVDKSTNDDGSYLKDRCVDEAFDHPDVSLIRKWEETHLI
jgi:hypothetical protein